MATHHLHTEIEIDASPERVWAVLSDFASYPQWNPFIKSISGTPRQGERLRITIQPGSGKGIRLSPVVLTADPGREVRWLVPHLFRSFLDGEHRILIEPLGEGKVRFQPSERVSRLLVRLLRGSLDRDTKRGYEEMSQPLKARAESA